MRYLTARKRAEGKGAAHTGTERHWSMTLTAVGLAFMVPAWLYIFGHALGGTREEVLATFARPFPAILTALVLVYTAQGLPLAVMILSEFIRQVPGELKDAARCDGVGEFRIFFRVILPLIRPAIATVAVFTMIPAWNDLWFPLILAPGDETRTVTLGVQQFIGQYVTDWNSVLAALSLAVLPILALYALFSRQLIRGLTSGAVK